MSRVKMIVITGLAAAGLIAGAAAAGSGGTAAVQAGHGVPETVYYHS